MINIPMKKKLKPHKIPTLWILCWSNSKNEISIITPAENPIINEINRGFGFLIKKAIKLPIVVANPAKKLKKRAKR